MGGALLAAALGAGLPLAGRAQTLPTGCTGRIVAGDFDGDGRRDYACMYDEGNATTQVWVLRSTGSSFSTELWAAFPPGYFSAASCDGRLLAADFDGDGKTDLACAL